jgi:DNA end-binding protein Ku
VIALEPHGKGLIGTTLRYPYEMRQSDDAFGGIENVKVTREMLELAEHILETKKGDFEPAAFEDHYETALVELLKKKQKGFKPPRVSEQANVPQNVINLMDALRKSVQSGKRTPPAQAKPANGKSANGKKGKKRVAGQTEMLLPIAGKGRAAAAAKSRVAVKKVAGRRKAG